MCLSLALFRYLYIYSPIFLFNHILFGIFCGPSPYVNKTLYIFVESIYIPIYTYTCAYSPCWEKNKHRLSCCCCCYCRSLFFRPTYLLSLIIACCSSLVYICLYVLWSIFASIEKNFCCVRLICWNKQCDWNESICWWRWWLLLQTISNVHFCVVFIFSYFFFFNFVRFFLFLLFSFFLHFFLFVFFLYKYFLQREKKKDPTAIERKRNLLSTTNQRFRIDLSNTEKIGSAGGMKEHYSLS